MELAKISILIIVCIYTAFNEINLKYLLRSELIVSIETFKWLHDISSYAISTYAISTVAISTVDNFNLLHVQPSAISTYTNLG